MALWPQGHPHLLQFQGRSWCCSPGLPSICAALSRLSPGLSTNCTLSLCTHVHWHLGALTCLWLICSQLGIPGGVGPGDVDPSSRDSSSWPGSLRPGVCSSCPGLSSHLSRRRQLSTLLRCLATMSCLCGCPGGWGFSHSAADASGNHRPLRTLSQPHLENPGQGTLAVLHSPATTPHGSYLLRQPQEAGAGAPRQQPQAPGPGTGQLPVRPLAPSARAGPSIGCPLLLLSSQVPLSPCSTPADHPHLACSIPFSHPHSGHCPPLR